MNEPPGCSKCRYSKRGCARCRDPTFKERQRVQAAGKLQPNKPGPTISRARKRSAEASAQDVKPRNLKRAREGKHTNNEAKEGVQSHAQAPRAKRQHKQATQASSAIAADTDVTQNSQADHQASRSCQAHAASPMDAPLQPRTDQSRNAQTDGGNLPPREAKIVDSGLELGLLAGMLPLQKEPGGAVPEKQAVNVAPSTSRDLDGVPAPERRRSADEESQHSKPKQSTSQQSKDLSQTSTGMQRHTAPIHLCGTSTMPCSKGHPAWLSRPTLGICFTASEVTISSSLTGSLAPGV